jgi:hypothetical protein
VRDHRREQIHELGPVRKPREGIVMCTVRHFGHRVRKRRFSRFAGLDVGGRNDRLPDRIGGVAERHGSHEVPAIDPIVPAQAHLAIDITARAQRGVCAGQCSDVIGMNDRAGLRGHSRLERQSGVC